MSWQEKRTQHSTAPFPKREREREREKGEATPEEDSKTGVLHVETDETVETGKYCMKTGVLHVETDETIETGKYCIKKERKGREIM